MISVVIPVFNRPALLKRAVYSVLAQRDVEFELIVVNDGSTVSLEAVEQLVCDSGHTFVTHGSRRGVSAARNYGVALSSGQWLAFLDSDDEWKPEKLSSQLKFHQDNPELEISQCREIWIRNGIRVNQKKIHAMPEGDAFERCLELCCISPSGVFLSSRLFSRSGGFDELLPVCEDYDLWLRISKDYPVGLVHGAYVVKYGGHEDQLSCSEVAIDRFRLYALLKLICLEELTEKQLLLVRDSARKKCEILLGGARKHRSGFLPLFEEISSELEIEPTGRLQARFAQWTPGLLEANGAVGPQD